MNNIKSIIATLKNILPIMLLGVGGVLIYQLKTLPDNISKAINPEGNVKTVIKTVAAPLDEKGDFLYFEGKIVEKPFNCKETLEYSTSWPDELYDGFFYVGESNKGARYYMWSKNGNFKEGKEIKGWFFATANSRWGHGKDWYYVLFPIMEKK